MKLYMFLRTFFGYIVANIVGEILCSFGKHTIEKGYTNLRMDHCIFCREDGNTQERKILIEKCKE